MRFIGHELRTPLNSVFMGMQLSIGHIPEDTQEPVEVERRETLVETQSACGAALDILNELLLFDKLETGALVLHKQSVPVTELVEDSVRMFSAQAREKNVELSITNNDETMLESSAEGRSEAPLVLCDTDEVTVDKNKVVQVIRNVVSNAIKFTPASGKIQVNLKFEPVSKLALTSIESPRAGLCCRLTRVAPDIDAKGSDDAAIDVEKNASQQVSGELVIEIKDSGAGISEENQRRLFKEVVQFNPELLQNGGGSGLGMCISKGIMDMHGGSISVHSPGEGRGSVFTLRLPMIQPIGQHASVYSPSAFVAVLRKWPSTKGSLSSQSSSLIFPTTEEEQTLAAPSIVCPERTSLGSSIPRVLSSSVLSGKSILSSGRSSTLMAEHPLRFLVVDDSKMNRKMLCRLLKNKGHVCTEAEDGVQAVAMMTAAQADVAIGGSTSSGKKAGAVGTSNTLDSPRTDIGASAAPAYDAILMDFM